MLTRLETKLLMEAQYNFPETHRPFHTIGERIGIEPEKTVEILRRLSRQGIVKRIGFYVNYRSVGLKAALIAYTAGTNIESIAKLYERDPYATHVYLRDHPTHNLWIVTKRRTVLDLVNHAKNVAGKYNIKYAVLLSKRTYKLSVKFDLEKGVSRAGPYSQIKPNPPSPENLGLTSGHLKAFRSLPVSLDPYGRIANLIGVSSEEAARIAWKLVELGLLGDPGVSLNGKSLGFEENAMISVKTKQQSEDELCRCLSTLDFTTHVVSRSVIPKDAWKYTCYFMVHARDKGRLHRLVDKAVYMCELQDYVVLRSIKDLKPGVVR